MRNPELDAITVELTNNGVRYSIEEDGKHLKIRWWHKGRPRIIGCARTASDWRAAANNRALVRRLLREDGYDVDAAPKPAPKITSLENVLKLPTPVDTTPDRLARLETEIKIVTDLLLDIAPAFDTTLDDVRNVAAARVTECDVALK